MISSPPIALTIAGSDCSGGAGIQADIKTFQKFGVHGLSAITSIVAETPLEVRQLEPVSISLLQEQINILLGTYPINAIKIGLLPSRASIIAVTESLQDTDIPIIIDPVMAASTGNTLMDENASSTFVQRLLPLATIITPNMPEASFLVGKKISKENDLEFAAQYIGEKFKSSCLIKGGHLANETELLDVLWNENKSTHFKHSTIPLPDLEKGLHGTGCTLSSAIAAGIANGQPIQNAVSEAINFVQNLIKKPSTWYHNDLEIRSLGW